MGIFKEFLIFFFPITGILNYDSNDKPFSGIKSFLLNGNTEPPAIVFYLNSYVRGGYCCYKLHQPH